jgi:hypothetical protein
MQTGPLDPAGEALRHLDEAAFAVRLARPGPAADAIARSVHAARNALRADADPLALGHAGDDETYRRTLLKLGGLLVVAGAASRDLVGGLAEVATWEGSTDGKVLDALADLTTLLATGYHTLPPEQLLPAVQAHLNRTVARLDAALSPADRARLGEVVGQTAALAGSLHFTLHRLGEARAHYELARQVARETDNLTVWAETTGLLSEVYSTIPRGGLHGDGRVARALAASAVQAAMDAPPGTVSWLAARLAEEHAAAGDATEADRALHRAEQAATAEERRPGFGFLSDTGFYRVWDTQRLRGYRGVVASLVGDTATATAVLRDATAPDRTARERANVGADLAAVYLTAGEPVQAAEIAGEALNAAAELDYAVGVLRLRGLAPALRTHTDVPEVRALLDRLQEVRP